MNKFKNIMLALVAVFAIGLTMTPVSVGAVNVFQPCDDNDTKSAVCSSKDEDNAQKMVKNIINVLLYILSIIAVVVIIIGGIMYATSGGDSGSITKAKNTILYTVIGLVVAFLSAAIVQFVIDQFWKSGVNN